MKTRRSFIAAALAAVMALTIAPLSGCGAAGTDAQAPQQSAAEQKETVRVAGLKGPTTIGLVDLMAKAKDGQTQDFYEFTVSGTPDEVVQKVVSGDVDVALVPSNLAAVLYQKTDGKVVAIDVNTLSPLCAVTAAEGVTDVGDLAGRTVYISGKGATPEYTLNYLLEGAGVAGSANVQYKSEHAEVVAALAEDPDAVAVLPQPFATVAISKVPGAAVAFNLGEAWKEVAPKGSELVMGVTVTRADFMAEHADAVSRFVECQRESVDSVLADPEAAAKLVVEQGIIDNEAVAAKAIPQCGLACLTGKDMKDALSGYLSVLFDADPASVGGGMPEDDFYWLD
ncbi:MqnA/MqnD/SBP family protein [Atopobiaceae bacterium 24-176]